MNVFCSLLYWGTFILGIYVLAIYPIILLALGFLAPRPVQKGKNNLSVSLIISAYNEEKVIKEKIENSLQLTHESPLEIIVASDCSTDATDNIAKEFAHLGVVLIRQSSRMGKTALLNTVVPRAKGDIVLFSDANAMYTTEALSIIVQNFSDPQVGCVCGDSRYLEHGGNNAVDQERRYWDYERFLKTMESRIGSLVGADGAIFAIRKTLFTPLETYHINDFVIPLQIVQKGWRVVFENKAICYEHTVASPAAGIRQKTRIVNRSLIGLLSVKEVLNPGKYGFFAVQVLSHKLLRWTLPFLFIPFFISNLALYHTFFLYKLTFISQLLFIICALIGAFLERFAIGWKIFSLPFYLCIVNFAAMNGVLKALRGEVEVVWQPSRNL